MTTPLRRSRTLARPPSSQLGRRQLDRRTRAHRRRCRRLHRVSSIPARAARTSSRRWRNETMRAIATVTCQRDLRGGTGRVLRDSQQSGAAAPTVRGHGWQPACARGPVRAAEACLRYSKARGHRDRDQSDLGHAGLILDIDRAEIRRVVAAPTLGKHMTTRAATMREKPRLAAALLALLFVGYGGKHRQRRVGRRRRRGLERRGTIPKRVCRSGRSHRRSR